MTNKYKQIGLIALAMAVVGCNMGDAPSGGSAAEVQANFDKEDPQKQIQTIQGSPASPEKKAQLIKAIEDKYHVKAGDKPVAGGSQSNPVGGASQNGSSK